MKKPRTTQTQVALIPRQRELAPALVDDYRQFGMVADDDLRLETDPRQRGLQELHQLGGNDGWVQACRQPHCAVVGGKCAERAKKVLRWSVPVMAEIVNAVTIATAAQEKGWAPAIY